MANWTKQDQGGLRSSRALPVLPDLLALCAVAPEMRLKRGADRDPQGQRDQPGPSRAERGDCGKLGSPLVLVLPLCLWAAQEGCPVAATVGNAETRVTSSEAASPEPARRIDGRYSLDIPSGRSEESHRSWESDHQPLCPPQT
ncbi:hypothetical protein NDU88_008196 [Pleurodeles waltl]|uniref:Uncharacterized protein n=1 Tax=Pleurodeles waltl TaxID=8319 RepID=A0AAV7RRM0_PLEWA|nr:hypothetical protein NDU88_008196 [Pleurodeles waltl]